MPSGPTGGHSSHQGRRPTPAQHSRSSEKNQQRNKNMTVLDEGVSLEERDDSRTEGHLKN